MNKNKFINIEEMVGMKNSKLFKLVAILGIGVLSIGMLSGCGKAAQSTTLDKDYIVMGTNAEFEPFEYREGTEVVGFDVELAKKIAEKLGKELRIEDVVFDSLIMGLNNKQMDFIAAGMTVTEDKKTQVDFSDSYFTSKQVIIVQADNEDIQTAADLAGKKVGVQMGTTGDDLVTETENIGEVVRLDKGTLAVMDLSNGTIDAVVIDEEPAKRMIEGQDTLKILEVPFIEEEYAIAVRKGDEEFLKVINEVLAEMKENGEYDALYAEYFSENE